MTTSQVVTITEELVAELERECSQEGREGHSLVIACPVMSALLAERAAMQSQIKAGIVTQENLELYRKDALRYQWLRNPDRMPHDDPFGHLIVGQAEGEDILWRDALDRQIDLDMQECQP